MFNKNIIFNNFFEFYLMIIIALNILMELLFL